MTFPPIRAAHYYPWYPEHWGEGHKYPPVLGEYETCNPTVMYWHSLWAKYAHLDAFIASWWGKGSPEDQKMQVLLDYTLMVESPNRDLKWTMQYETEGYSNPTVGQLVDDLHYLDRYFDHPSYLRVGGAPVLFVYGAGSDGDPAETSKRWRKALSVYGKDVYLLLEAYDGFLSDPNRPSAWHQYNPTKRIEFSAYPDMVSVSTEFGKPGAPQVLNPDPVDFERVVKYMVDSQAHWQIFYFNEWREASQIEPTTAFADWLQYLRIISRNTPGPNYQ